MIGAGTMRAECYGRVIGDPAKRDMREGAGLARDPLMVIVSGSLDLPWDAPLFSEGRGEVAGVHGVRRAIRRRPRPRSRSSGHDGMVDLAEALAHLRREEDVRSLLCEGGPHLHAQLLQAGLVDEIFVTHAPKLAGGEGPGLVAGLTEAERPLELVWLAQRARNGRAVRPLPRRRRL